jgi:hypothetical protein
MGITIIFIDFANKSEVLSMDIFMSRIKVPSPQRNYFTTQYLAISAIIRQEPDYSSSMRMTGISEANEISRQSRALSQNTRRQFSTNVNT